MLILYHINKEFKVHVFPLNLVVSFNVLSMLMLNVALTSANVYPLGYLILSIEIQHWIKRKKEKKKKRKRKLLPEVQTFTCKENDYRKLLIFKMLEKILIMQMI